MKRKYRILALILAAVLLTAAFGGCAGKNGKKNPDLNTKEEITLRIVGSWDDFTAIDAIGEMFSEKYPNCKIVYEQLQDYYASLEKRLKSGEETIDLFVTTNIQPGSSLVDYSLDLYSDKRVDLSDTYPGLVRNFEYQAEGGTVKLYAVPMGAEMRGMFVNKTLLKSLDIEVPSNRSELIAACEKLKENGYIPMQGNPASFAQHMLYPYICNIIANNDDYETVYASLENRDADVGELFRDPLEFLYSLVENGYYNYKYVESSMGMFIDASDEGVARYFLNIANVNGEYVKKDDLGVVAFMPAAMSQGGVLEKMKDDYHSAIEYEFILSPVSDEGGYAYMSPAHGIAINKSSQHLDWCIEFFNFLFEENNNVIFAEKYHVAPNTADALKLITKDFNVPENQISELGQVTFSYNFYSIITETLRDISKANNPKYMDADGTVMYSYEHYIKDLEDNFAEK